MTDLYDFNPSNGMLLVADTWYSWDMLELQGSLQIYNKQKQDDHKAIDVGRHGTISNEPLFLFLASLVAEKFSLLSLSSH